MIYRVGILIEELVDEDDTIQGETWYRRLRTFDNIADAVECMEKTLLKGQENE